MPSSFEKMWGKSLDEWGQPLLKQNHHPQQANCSRWGWERHGLKYSGSILIYFACIRVLWIERKISVSQNNETPGPSDNRGKSPGVLKSVLPHTKLHAFAHAVPSANNALPAPACWWTPFHAPAWTSSLPCCPSLCCLPRWAVHHSYWNDSGIITFIF